MQSIVPVAIDHLEHLVLVSEPGLFLLRSTSAEPFTVRCGKLADEINRCQVDLVSQRVVLILSVVVHDLSAELFAIWGSDMTLSQETETKM